MLKIAIQNSDAIIKGTQNLSEEISNEIIKLKKPVLEYYSQDNFSEAYINFYLNEVLA
jgi:starch synthase